MDFLRRSYESELIDDPAVPFSEIRRNLHELDVINTWLGGHAISIKGLKKIIRKEKTNPDRCWHVCEIGCGGGDNLKSIASWCIANDIKAKFTGIDINRHCIHYASGKQYPQPVQFIESDYRNVSFDISAPDVIFNSLFCHHFNDREIIEMLRWMKKQAIAGFFINDLQRHPLPYYLIKYITKIFSRSRLVKNDAPLSVSRGFKKPEWTLLLQNAGISNATVSWEWAFRYLIVYTHASKHSDAANG